MGDRILLGFARDKCEPAVEHIKKMAGGGARNLELLFARRVDGASSGTVYDYAAEKSMQVERLRGDGNFILLKYMPPGGCTSAAPPSPAEVLGPAFDLGESLPGEGVRIFYYSDSIGAGQWFEVAEARLNADTKYMYGTYYLDCINLLRVMEEGSRPLEVGGARFIRTAVREGAYYLSSGGNRTASCDDNWMLTQRSLVARIVNVLNRMRENGSRVCLSRRLGTDGMAVQGLGELTDETLIAGVLLVLKAQEGHLHITPAIMPYGPYINGLLAKIR